MSTTETHKFVLGDKQEIVLTTPVLKSSEQATVFYRELTKCLLTAKYVLNTCAWTSSRLCGLETWSSTREVMTIHHENMQLIVPIQDIDFLKIAIQLSDEVIKLVPPNKDKNELMCQTETLAGRYWPFVLDQFLMRRDPQDIPRHVLNKTTAWKSDGKTVNLATIFDFPSTRKCDKRSYETSSYWDRFQKGQVIELYGLRGHADAIYVLYNDSATRGWTETVTFRDRCLRDHWNANIRLDARVRVFAEIGGLGLSVLGYQLCPIEFFC